MPGTARRLMSILDVVCSSDALQLDGERLICFARLGWHLMSGDDQEWPLGFEFTLPSEFRQGHGRMSGRKRLEQADRAEDRLGARRGRDPMLGLVAHGWTVAWNDGSR